MKITKWYRDNFESDLNGRYITNQHISPLLENYKTAYEISVAGYSENNLPISLIKVGNGTEVVLGWSQMHGNESTTTKAIFDFLKFLSQKELFQNEIQTFLNTYSFYILPILNPDGALVYTRENIKKVDLNRDAQDLSQSESQVLRKAFDTINPSLCLNMHDQRSIFGFANGNNSVVSFLSPAADINRSLTHSRIAAMEYIVKMNTELQKHIPGHVGRYDDSFNPNCVGDTFQNLGVPTILFEAGHYKLDYQREKTREFIFYSLLALFDITPPQKNQISHEEYFTIPENLKNYNDIILRNFPVKGSNISVCVAIQYHETLKNDKIAFIARVWEVGDLRKRYAFSEKDMKFAEILTESQDFLTVGTNISELLDKTDDLAIFCKNILLL